jgi:predicted GTPase
VETRSEKSSTSTDQKLKADGESAGAKLRPTENNNNNNNNSNKNVAIPNGSCPFYWKNGWCRYKARCRFTHPNNPALKHKRCRMFFKKGNCPLGNTCPFSHVDGDFGSHDGSENNNLKSSNDMEGHTNGMKFDWANVKGHKKVIVLGGSGHGKSTFINSLHNYFKNLPIEKMEVVIRTPFLNAVNSAPKDTEMDFHDSTSSKTQYCTEYRFPSPDNRSSITFVDTPGLADTRGVSQDEKNMEFILAKAKEIEQSGDLLGIILIMKGTDARKNLSIRTITTFLMGNLPDLVLQNLIVIFTACSSKGKCTALSLTPWAIKEDLTFFIDNGAFASDFCALSAREKRIARNDWTDTMEELDCLLNLLSTMKVIPSDDQFTQLFKQRMSVKSSFNTVKQKIIEMQNVLQKLEVLQTQRNLAEDRKEKNKNFMTKEKIPIIELIDDPNAPLSTICSACMQFCHNPCSLAEITSKGSVEFKGCAAFHGAANCRICLPDGATIGCSFETHFHGRKRLEKREDTIEKVLENIKQEYDAANQDLHVVDKSLNELDNAKRLVNLAIDGLVRDLSQQVNCLKKICSGINLVNEIQIVLQQLTAESRLITNVQARDKADAVITAITAMMNSVSSITRPPPPPSDTYCRPVKQVWLQQQDYMTIFPLLLQK